MSDKQLFYAFLLSIGLLGLFGYVVFTKSAEMGLENLPVQTGIADTSATEYWHAPDISTLENHPDKESILYGKDLIVRTAYYLGPKGSVAQTTNGMNCQNCHLDAGTKVFGNNYGSVFATYPKYRPRSGTKENIQKRITDCFERSLNGKAPDSSSAEMKAIVAYINWLGKDVAKGEKANGSGFKEVAFLDRPADPV